MKNIKLLELMNLLLKHGRNWDEDQRTRVQEETERLLNEYGQVEAIEDDLTARVNGLMMEVHHYSEDSRNLSLGLEPVKRGAK